MREGYLEEIDHALSSMDDGEIIDLLKVVLSDPAYEANDYTSIMSNMAETAVNLSRKQRSLIEIHLKINHRFWF